MVVSCENASMTSNGAVVRVRGIAAVRVQRLVPGRLEGDVLLPEQRLDLDRGPRLVAEPRVRRLEGDHDVVAVELDVGDGPDPDARDADVVVGLQARGLGEPRGVRRPLPDEGQVADVQRREHEQHQHDEAHRADDDGVPFPERLHPPHRYPAPRAAGGSERLTGGRGNGARLTVIARLAQVEVEPGPVAAGPAEVVGLLRDVPQGVLHEASVAVEDVRLLAELDDVVGQRRAGLLQEAGGDVGEVGDGLQRGPDRDPVLRQPGDQLLERDDAAPRACRRGRSRCRASGSGC